MIALWVIAWWLSLSLAFAAGAWWHATAGERDAPAIRNEPITE